MDNSILDKAKLEEWNDLSLVDLARELRRVGDLHDEAKEIVSDLYKDLQTLSVSIIPERMADEEITTMNIDGVGRLQCRTDAYVSVLKADKPEFMQWCIDSNNAPLIKEDIHPATLKAFIKDRVKQGLEYPSHLVKFEPYEKAVVVKVAA